MITLKKINTSFIKGRVLFTEKTGKFFIIFRRVKIIAKIGKVIYFTGTRCFAKIVLQAK